MSTNAKQSVDRLPPHSAEAEQGVLGCVLLEGRCLDAAKEIKATADWFYDLRHRLVWNAFEKLDAQRAPIDLLSVSQVLKDGGVLEEAGGLSALMALPGAVPSAANLPHYLGILKEKHQLRTMLRTLADLQGRIWEWEGTVEDYLSSAADEVLSAAAVGITNRERSVKEILPEVIDGLEAFVRGKQKLRGLSTGYGYWDKVLQGVRHDSYLCIAARPGDGKTAMALNLARFMAMEYEWWTPKRDASGQVIEVDGAVQFDSHIGIPVGFFSLEMSDASLVERLLFCDSQVSAGKFNQGFISQESYPKLTASGARLAQSKIWVDQSEALTISELRSRARRMAREHGIRCFFIDYLQLVRGYPGKKYRDDVERLNDISEGLRLLVKELKVPVVVLAQMNRNIEQSEATRVPVLGDLKGCGAIEQDAAQVCFLFRPAAKKLEDEFVNANTEQMEKRNALSVIEEHFFKLGLDKTQHPQRIDVWVAKNRGGPTGLVEMMFQRDYVRFECWWKFCTDNGYKWKAKGE